MRGTRKIFLFLLIFLLTGSLAFSVIPNQKKQPRPIKSGTSGGNIKDQNTEFCCSGTIGAVVKDNNGKFYLLSNNHVFAKSNLGHAGDLISQPGLIDSHCESPEANDVASLTKFVKIKFGRNTNNKVDAAIAQVMPGKVNQNGFILSVGNPGQPVEAILGMKVMKSGRTTGFTRGGTVDIVNFTVLIGYSNTCGGPENKPARFINQVHILAGAKKFSAGGDSGSLIVEDKKPCPHTVALLFAGDDFGNTTGSRIQDVLAQLSMPINNVGTPGLKMVGSGCPSPAAEPANTSIQMETEMIAAKAVQARHEEALMQIPGVIGVGIGLANPNSGSKKLAIVVLVTKGSKAEAFKSAVPSELDGMPVRRQLSGEIKAF